MKNQVIKVESIEHGKRVLEYWKGQGLRIDTCDIEQDFLSYQDDGLDLYVGRYEELSHVQYDCSHQDFELITLPEEKPYPKMMMVWDGQTDTKFRALVIGYFNGFYIADTNREEVCNGSSFYPYGYAEDIPEKIKVTREEIAEWKGVDKDLIEIV